MQAPHNPNQMPMRATPPHLTPLESPRRRPASDRTILRRYRELARKTGDYQGIPQIAEIARLAHARQLIGLKQAQVLFDDLNEVEATLNANIEALARALEQFRQGVASNQTTLEDKLMVRDRVQALIEPLDWLLATARQHRDPQEPGVEDGFASCYCDTIKRVNDIRHSLAYISENYRPSVLKRRLRKTANPQLPELEMAALETAIDDLQFTAADLIPRLRSNISRKVPQFWGSFPD